MEQVTQPATLTAPSETRAPAVPLPSIKDAYALAGRIIDQLTTLPRDISIKRELTGEYSVHIYWSHDVSGVLEIAARADQPLTIQPSDRSPGIYAEVRTRTEGIEVWAWTLLTRDEADQLEHLSQPPAQATDTTPTVAPAESVPAVVVPVPVPLGSSVVAHVPAVADTVQDQAAGGDR
ncbi:hypothetical protein [Streptomyces sp. NPDC002845]